MEINQLRYFCVAAKLGSFSKAAATLYITQPALSKSIAKLEAELGAPLFERNGIHIHLTYSGKIFLPYCHNILNSIESSLNAVRENVGCKKGHLTIAISPEIYIKHIIFEFLGKNPEVSFSSHLMNPEEMSDALEEGKIDFAISSRKITGNNITWEKLYSGGLTAVLNRNDPLLKKHSISMKELKDHYFCIGHLRTNLQSSIFELCHEAGFEPKIRYQGYDPDMAGLLLEFENSGIISSQMIDYGIRSFEKKQDATTTVPIKHTENRSIVGIALRDQHYLSEAAVSFKDMVVNHYAIKTGT